MLAAAQEEEGTSLQVGIIPGQCLIHFCFLDGRESRKCTIQCKSSNREAFKYGIPNVISYTADLT